MTEPVQLKLEIPFREGVSLPIYVYDMAEVDVPGEGTRMMTFYEFVTNPKTSRQAAEFLSETVKDQTKLSVSQTVKGFMDQFWQGASLGWSEEIGSYFAGIPRLMPGGKTYSEGVADYREKQRAENELFQFLRPKTSEFAQGVGLTAPIVAAMVEPTPLGEAGVAGYQASRVIPRALNPFGIAGTTMPTTFTESILKAMVLSAGHSAGAAEGYWKERLANVPSAMREGMEWGILTNVALFGSMAAINGLMRIPWARTKMQDIDFYESLGPEWVKALETSDEAYRSRFNARAQELLVTEYGLDVGKLMRGKGTTAEIKARVEEALAPLRERMAVESELMLGEQGGRRWRDHQLRAMQDDPLTGDPVIDKIVAREAGDPARVSAALRENQPTTLLESANQALNLRQARLTGRETDPISGEMYPAGPVGLLGADAMPLTSAGRPQGVTGIYYEKGYTANDVPLSGTFMKTFRGWRGWEKIYKQAQGLRNARIHGPDKESAPYTATGLSNELPPWQDFLDGVRYIPKSTAKEHGRAVKQQLNPKTGQWVGYKNKPHKGWSTRTRVVFDDFKVIEQQKNPATQEWSDVPVGRNPRKGWDTRQKTVGGDWAVRLNEKAISFETLHDMRKAMDQELGQLESAGKMSEFNAIAPFRTQLDDAIKASPDMARADNYFSAFKKMEAAAASGRGAWDKSLLELTDHYNRMSTEQKRMFRTAMIETAERNGFTSSQLMQPRISGKVAQVPGKIRMLYPEGPEGQLMYEQAMKELGMSDRMHQTYSRASEATPLARTQEGPRGAMKTLSLLAKIPAYQFSFEFALGRDLIEQARKVDASVRTGVAKEVNKILSTKSGPEAAAMIDDLASTAVRMSGNVPAADSLKGFARTLRSVVGYQQAGQEVDRVPNIQGDITGMPQGEVEVPEGLFDYILEDDPAYQRRYPATEAGGLLMENVGVPVADYLKRKVPSWWHGPQ